MHKIKKKKRRQKVRKIKTFVLSSLTQLNSIFLTERLCAEWLILTTLDNKYLKGEDAKEQM